METIDFLNDWLAWAEQNSAARTTPYKSPLGVVYKASDGLCGSVTQFYKFHGLGAASTRMVLGLMRLFVDDGLCKSYPFNEDMADHYRESRLMEMHVNEKRLAWVRKKIKELEDAQQ